MKDVSRDELTHAIRTVHGGGSLLQPVIASRLIQGLGTQDSAQLTERELDVLREMDSGAQNKEIADRLVLSINTVRFHVANTFQKLDVRTRTQAVHVARERGILSS